MLILKSLLYACYIDRNLPLVSLYLLIKPHHNRLGIFKDLSVYIETDSGKRRCFILCYDDKTRSEFHDSSSFPMRFNQLHRSLLFGGIFLYPGVWVGVVGYVP
jgi:hypothetical protein